MRKLLLAKARCPNTRRPVLLTCRPETKTETLFRSINDSHWNLNAEGARMNKTVVAVDLHRYNDAVVTIEAHIGAEAVPQLNQQIQQLINFALEKATLTRKDSVLKETGDGAILTFEPGTHAHIFSEALHNACRQHNHNKDEGSTCRWFRIGVATGELAAPRGRDPGGAVINRAVRLEGAAKIGQTMIDQETYDELPKPLRPFYGAEEVVQGKNGESYLARRYTVIHPDEPPPPSGKGTIVAIEFTLNKPLGEFDEETFKKAFHQIGIDPIKIRIYSIRPGSTIVTIASDSQTLNSILHVFESSPELAREFADDTQLLRMAWEVNGQKREIVVDRVPVLHAEPGEGYFQPVFRPALGGEIVRGAPADLSENRQAASQSALLLESMPIADEKIWTDWLRETVDHFATPRPLPTRNEHDILLDQAERYLLAAIVEGVPVLGSGKTVYFAKHIVRPEHFNFAFHITEGSYWRLEREWLKSVKELRAYHTAQSRYASIDPAGDYLEACRHFDHLLLSRESKAIAFSFETVKRYLNDRYLVDGKIKVRAKSFAATLVHVKADRLSKMTGRTDTLYNWGEAEHYVKKFYENIIPAVEEKDGLHHVKEVLDAFRFSTDCNHCYHLINCFEMAIAINFLDPEKIRAVW
jgi:class 3 adenylate cyclase